jgi:hypothetical protein
MSKIIIFLVILGSLIGCTEANVEKKSTTYIVRENNIPIEVVIIDSCEYLYGPWGNATVLTHKGNCKYCKQRNNE